MADGLADVVVLALQLQGLLGRSAVFPVQRGVDDVDEVAQFELIRVRVELAREVEARGGHQLKNNMEKVLSSFLFVPDEEKILTY